MAMWKRYKNGNSIVSINLEDGTKIRETDEDEFDLEFPETLDINCTTYCDLGCPFCYAGCSVNGRHADIMNAKIIDSLHPWTEVALQLNDLSHPDLIPFLQKLKAKNIIANITVNQVHFERKEDLIRKLADEKLVYGIGISLRDPNKDFIERVKRYPNAIIHTIAGVLSEEHVNALKDNDLKVLILGYKTLGRGIKFASDNVKELERNMNWLYDNLPYLPAHFKCLCFDNLALEQLNPKRFLSDSEWENMYMGDEGTASMFVDLVRGKFGKSSLCTDDEMYPLMDDVKDMFKVIKKEVA